MKYSQLFTEQELKELSQGLPEGVTPVWEYWEEFVNKYLRLGRSEITLRSVKSTLRMIVLSTDLRCIEDFNDHNLLEDELMELQDEKGFGNVTYNSYIKNVNTYFRWLEDKEYIEQNKIRKIRKAKENINEQYTFNESDVLMVKTHLHDRRQNRLEKWRNIFFFGLLTLTGARPCELLQLKLSDIEFTKGTYKLLIRGRKQKGKMRPYRLPSSLRDTYEMYMKVRSDLDRDEEFLFVSNSRKTGWTYRGVNKLCQRLSKELGFKVTTYAYRRFVATRLHNEGVPLREISNFLGHTKEATTLKYIQSSCLRTDGCVDVMEGVV